MTIVIPLNSAEKMEALMQLAPAAPLYSTTRKRKKLLPRISSSTWDSYQRFHLKGKYEDCVDGLDTWDSESLIGVPSGDRLLPIHEKHVYAKQSKGLLPESSTLSALLLYYARNNLFSKAQTIWDDLLNSSFMPDPELVSELIFIYGRIGDFDRVAKILHEMQIKDSKLLPDIMSLSVTSFGQRGYLDCMEMMIQKIVAMGYPVSSVAGNAYVVHYSTFGSLADMELAVGRLKRSRILIEENAIRAVSLAYIKKNKFYSLGRFVNDVGLGRKNVGNLLWNLLLLSYGAKFKMKSLQREFVRMVESGFCPDLDTFNIRALAFSRMCLMWDLHLSLEHMKHDGICPDLVTYGCVVDAYMERRLGRNLRFALGKMGWDGRVLMGTDYLVFEAMGKGEFHSSSEVVMEYWGRKDWTYRMLVSVYLKKKFRRNQIFWNY
ncbi:pentatricopeptide repeat-containing family protein [Striga asiatica]|uniref:Pentatricopeptide repeat-containing family protein n=1 Tax=Striga asiatica TaxID=4170 RepID=A0A5A7QAG1_STRAF|nr:pentatricopeptide repeat-containing family protein [Striga asiatica]